MKSYRAMDLFSSSSRRAESEFRGLRHISLRESLQKSEINIIKVLEKFSKSLLRGAHFSPVMLKIGPPGAFGHAESDSEA